MIDRDWLHVSMSSMNYIYYFQVSIRAKSKSQPVCTTGICTGNKTCNPLIQLLSQRLVSNHPCKIYPTWGVNKGYAAVLYMKSVGCLNESLSCNLQFKSWPSLNKIKEINGREKYWLQNVAEQQTSIQESTVISHKFFFRKFLSDIFNAVMFPISRKWYPIDINIKYIYTLFDTILHYTVLK